MVSDPEAKQTYFSNKNCKFEMYSLDYFNLSLFENLLFQKSEKIQILHILKK